MILELRAKPGTIFVARDYCALPHLYAISNEVKGIEPAIKTRYAAGLFLFGRLLVPIITEPAKEMLEKANQQLAQLAEQNVKTNYNTHCQIDLYRPSIITVSGLPNEAMIHNILTALDLGLKKNGYLAFSTASPYPGEITAIFESPNFVSISGLLHPSEIGVLADCCEVYMIDDTKSSINIERPLECGKCIEDVVTSVVEEVREIVNDEDLPEGFERIRFIPGRPKAVTKLDIMIESIDDDEQML